MYYLKVHYPRINEKFTQKNDVMYYIHNHICKLFKHKCTLQIVLSHTINESTVLTWFWLCMNHSFSLVRFPSPFWCCQYDFYKTTFLPVENKLYHKSTGIMGQWKISFSENPILQISYQWTTIRIGFSTQKICTIQCTNRKVILGLQNFSFEYEYYFVCTFLKRSPKCEQKFV